MSDFISKMKKLVNSELIVVFDFDYTITTKDSNSSIGVFSNYLPKRYKSKKMKLDYLTNKVRNRFAYLLIWKLKLKLLENYNAEEYLNIINYRKEFILNREIVKVIRLLSNSGSKIIIYSSGIKEVIERVLCFNSIGLDNIEIRANSLYEDGLVITPNKKKIKDLNEDRVILIGDSKSDLNIIKSDFLVQIVDDVPIIRKWR